MVSLGGCTSACRMYSVPTYGRDKSKQKQLRGRNTVLFTVTIPDAVQGNKHPPLKQSRRFALTVERKVCLRFPSSENGKVLRNETISMHAASQSGKDDPGK